MKRTITGWIQKDNLNKPFFVDSDTDRIGTVASTHRKAFISKLARKSLIRVKITVETFEPKKRTPKLLPCDFCDIKPELVTDETTLKKSFWYVCAECGNTHPRAHSKAEALKAWNNKQKGKA